ncbi:MAG: DUF99 family protein [Candidatus Caldarchaeum sp.]|nr:DUF99 family protein [Candidatus Caldarchaeum sp.]MCX8201579.1 DUF99 family protein [Candidatus Caldarchaeum sp.]MDW8063878.1 DUF99 family protein [Candidatus Caldarchaeum sp.]MDW8436052.1 DUF99 family protein [Candidatus Caldarchaeum sp.]
MPTKLRVGKKGIRALGISESFRKHVGSRAILAGVVMRSDMLVDGFGFSTCTVGGLDSTDSMIAMWQRLDREDINVVMLSGSVISWFNVVDLNRLYETMNIPLICLSYRDSKGLDDVFRKRFPDDWERRLAIHQSNGERTEILLKTGYKVFVRCLGLEVEEAKKVLDRFLVDGRYPEPVRLAKILARSVLKNLEPFLRPEPGVGNIGGEAV